MKGCFVPLNSLSATQLGAFLPTHLCLINQYGRLHSYAWLETGEEDERDPFDITGLELGFWGSGSFLELSVNAALCCRLLFSANPREAEEEGVGAEVEEDERRIQWTATVTSLTTLGPLDSGGY